MTQSFQVGFEGERFLLEFDNACRYDYSQSTEGLKYQAIDNYVIVTIPKSENCEKRYFILKGTYDGITREYIFNQGTNYIVYDYYYYGYSSSQPSTESDFILHKVAMEDSALFTISQINKCKYLWVAVPDDTYFELTDDLGNTMTGWGEQSNKKITEIQIDGQKYLLYLYRSDLNISNTYKLKING